MRRLRLVLGNLAAWTHGACIVYPSEIFDPSAIVDAVSEERCTALHGVPTHFLGVLAEVQRRRDEGQAVDTRNLRYVRPPPFCSLIGVALTREAWLPLPLYVYAGRASRRARPSLST